MRAVSDYRADVLTILGDATGRRYSESILDVGLRKALSTYGDFFPRKELVRASVTEVENDGAVVPWMFGADTDVLSVKYRGEYCPFSAYKEPGRLILNMPEMPAAGEMLEITVRVPHTIKGLDEKTQTTVPDAHCMILSTGAAGHAMHIRARSVTEVFGKRPEDREALTSQAEALLSEFWRELSGIQAAPVDPLPRGNFEI